MGQQNFSCKNCSCEYEQEVADVQSVRPHPEMDSLSYRAKDPQIVENLPTIKVLELPEALPVLQECNSSEPTVPTPDASLRSERFTKNEIKEMVKEFESEAMSGKGVSCEIYQKESDSIELRTCTMFLNMDAAAMRLSMNNSKYSKQFLELPLASIRVFNSEQLKSQSCSCDSGMVELQREDPFNNLHLSIFLVSREESHWIVLDDEKMMIKVKYGLKWLSKYFQEKARKD